MTEQEAISILNDIRQEARAYRLVPTEINALDIAISTLEKHIPKKPKGDLHSVPHYRCPTCNSSVRLFDNSPKSPICLSCWQRIDWSEE